MLSRPFLVLFGAMLVASMGISMVSPILPVYAERLGAAGIWIGLTFSIFALSQAIVSPFAGGLSDRYGRKPFMVVGLLIYVFAAIGFLTADSFVQVLAFRLFSGCGTGLLFSVGQAYLGDIVPKGQEGRWLGIFAISDIAGFGLGPVVSGIIRDVFGFDSVFVGMAILMGASAVIVFVLLPERGREERATTAEPRSALRGMRDAFRHRAVVAVILFMGLSSLTFGSVFAFLAIFLDSMGASATAIGAVFAVQFLAGGIAQPFLGRIADRVDRRKMLLVGLSASALCLLAVGAAPSYIVVFALLVILGIANATAWVAAGAIQVVAGRVAGMGTVIGLGATGDGLGILTGGILGGAFAGWFGTAAAFYFGASALAVGTIVLAWLLAPLPTSSVNAEREPTPEAIPPPSG